MRLFLYTTMRYLIGKHIRSFGEKMIPFVQVQMTDLAFIMECLQKYPMTRREDPHPWVMNEFIFQNAFGEEQMINGVPSGAVGYKSMAKDKESDIFL